MHQKILSKFQIKDKITESSIFGSGLIHDTFKIITEEGVYILQQINHSIFKDIEALMDNIQQVTKQIQQNIRAENKQERSLHFYTTSQGKAYIQDQDGNYWRLMDFIKDSYSYDRAENKSLVYEGGVTIGHFLSHLSALPQAKIKETIPQFHNIKFRINNLQEALKKDVAKRANSIQEDINFALERTEEMVSFLDFVKEKNIPIRILHNDLKINNFLFDEGGKGICMIDLDTVMPGYIHYDYGDAIRSLCSTSDEDELDLSKIDFKVDYYQAFTQGFLQETEEILTPEEINSLPFAPKLLTYIVGIKFLTDYLNGDIYFKIKYPQHNLDRARNQFRLLERMEVVL